MLSQLGLPASNRDTLTLIHSTGEVLSLARRCESTNTETFTLHQRGSAACTSPPSLFLSVSHLSLSLCSSHCCFPLTLSLSSSQSALFPQASSQALSFLLLFICLSVYLSHPLVNISLCSSASLILSLLFILIWCQLVLLLSKAMCDVPLYTYLPVFSITVDSEFIPQTVFTLRLPLLRQQYSQSRPL